MESFDSKVAGISKLRTYVRLCTCVRRRVQMRYSGTRGASWPVTPTLLCSCILGNNVRRNDGHQRRSRLFRFFIVRKMHFLAALIIVIFSNSGCVQARERFNASCSRFVLYSPLFSPLFFPYQIELIIVANYNRIHQRSIDGNSRNERIARRIASIAHAALNVKNITAQFKITLLLFTCAAMFFSSRGFSILEFSYIMLSHASRMLTEDCCTTICEILNSFI
jgi:hypothetical protein